MVLQVDLLELRVNIDSDSAEVVADKLADSLEIPN